MSRLRDQYYNNPVLYDLRRGIQKASPRNWQLVHAAVAILVILGLLLLGFSFFSNVSVVDASVPLFIMLPILTLVIPTVLHATFAGEWQARSLNSLLVAPLTTRDLVIAKVLRSLLPFFVLTLLWCVVALAAQGIQEVMAARGVIDAPARAWPDVVVLVPLAVVASFAYTLFLVGVTALVSSYTKTTSAALLGTLGALIIVLLIIPVMIGVLPGGGQVLTYIHPFAQIASLSSSLADESWNLVPPLRESWLLFAGVWAAWAALGICGLYATISRMTKLRQAGIED